jgi:hypothetical protein
MFFFVCNRLLLSHIFYHQLISIIWVLCKNVLFFNRFFHFQKSFIKPKLKIGSNGYLIWVSWNSCVLKKNNMPWLPWFQIATFVVPLIVFWPHWYWNLSFSLLFGFLSILSFLFFWFLIFCAFWFRECRTCNYLFTLKILS